MRAKSQRPDERGMALVLTILVLLILTTIGVTMVITSQGDHKLAANERDSERALFAAKSGLTHAYFQFEQGGLLPTMSGTAFDSSDPAVQTPLKGAAFTGTVQDLSSFMGEGQLYRIESTGTFNRASRTTELVFQIVPEAFKYGYMAFNQATLHNHSGLSGPSFSIESTIFSNGDVEIPEAITLAGSIVSAGRVIMEAGSTVEGDVFSNFLEFDNSLGPPNPVIEGDVKRLTAVEALPASETTYDRLDNLGNKYAWFNGLSTPGSVLGTGTINGSNTAYTIQNGDPFRYTIFRKDGTLLSNPNINVLKFVPPPKIDYQAMKAEADKNDPTYFTSMADAMSYLVTKKVSETIGGKTVTTIKVGTPAAPEFLYVDDNFILALDPNAGADDPATGLLVAHGFNLEGGIYTSGNFQFNGPEYNTTDYPPPPGWYEFRVNALPYCFPAIVAYPEPSSGSIASWTPNDTPPMAGAVSNIDMKSNPPGGGAHEGYVLLNGLTYSEADTHLHHTQSTDELIRFNGAELGYKVHNCDYFSFTYDPAVRCTRFLVADEGTPETVSYRELR